VLIARPIQSYIAWQAVRMQMSVAPLAGVTDAGNYPPTQDVRVYYQSIFGRVDLVIILYYRSLLNNGEITDQSLYNY
jgi:hypothetical protein